MKLFAFFTRFNKKRFLDVLEEYFDKKAKRVKGSTQEKHHYFKENIRRYFEAIGDVDIRVNEIRISTMEDIRTWLHADAKRTAEHVSRHIEHCVSAMDHDVYMEYTDRNPIQVISPVRETPKEPVSCDVHEVRILMGFRARSLTERLAVHLFLFQCFTGLSFMDLWRFEIIERRGKQLVAGGRGKNGKRYWAAFNKYAREIYEQYDVHGTPFKFPLLCNQVYNKTLRRVAKRLGINKHLTTHVGRKTYATLKWNMGQSIETIAAELGNTPEMVKRRYVTEGPDRVVNEDNRLEGIPLLPEK